jgi:hypothetical protein
MGRHETQNVPRWRYSNRITKRAANRAIYFDFEGRMNESPALMGVYAGGWFRHFVFDKDLGSFVKSSRDAGERVFRRNFADAIDKELLRAAESEDRRLIAFSEHELRCIHAAVGSEVAERVADRFLNARAFVAAWINRDRRDLRVQLESATLENFANICGFDWPEEYELEPADAIRRLRARLATSSKRRRPIGRGSTELWARLLGYNRYDCLATKHIVLYALRNSKPPGEQKGSSEALWITSFLRCPNWVGSVPKLGIVASSVRQCGARVRTQGG